MDLKSHRRRGSENPTLEQEERFVEEYTDRRLGEFLEADLLSQSEAKRIQKSPAQRKGILYLVGTPIGNLGDITFRAVEVLKKVSLIAAEDTRRTKILCQRYRIETPLVSLHEHNERARSPELIHRLQTGESVAVVTDAGMPVVSDPGAWLIDQVRAAGVPVTVVPGPSAVTAALAVSGLRGERFRFEGFPPRKEKALKEWLGRLKEESQPLKDPAPVVCFESPFRLKKTLQAIQKVLGEIPIVVARELTKLHEEVTRGSTGELLKRYTERSAKGECTVVFLPQGEISRPPRIGADSK